jgi:Zn finger protein HypA/HybF involved in hydrogenase expression
MEVKKFKMKCSYCNYEHKQFSSNMPFIKSLDNIRWFGYKDGRCTTLYKRLYACPKCGIVQLKLEQGDEK